MIQFCRKAIVEPLRTLFLSFLEDGVYPNNWKKSIFVQLHKKEKKYKPISLLPAFSQVFERILFNSLFNFFLENKLLPKCQFTKFHFLQRDFCIPQFLSWHTRYINLLIVTLQPMQEGLFLDISKAFDKVWLDGLI